MTTRKQKALLVLISLAITLLFIESAARFAGFIYKNYMLGNGKVITNPDKNITKILCLGDSFTFGEGGGYGNDYPAQLEKLLNANTKGKKFTVYNRGVPGNNSSMVLKRLVNNINTYKPDIVLLLIGSNDSTTLEDSDYYLFKSSGIGKMAAFFLRLDIFLSKAKTYKFIKILVLNLKNKFCFENSPANAISQEELDRPKKKMFDISNRNPNSDKKEIYLKKAESLCLDSKFTLAIDILKSYLQDNPRDAEAIFNLGKNYYLQGKNDPAIKKEYFQQAIRMFNESLLYIDPDSLLLKAENYSYLARLYFDQGENNLARETIDKALKIFPHNQFYRQFIRYLSEASLSQKQKEMFRKLFYYNLGKIINLCRIYNTRIILLNYPSEFQGSSVREAIASVYQVPFIDIGSEFEKAQSSNEKNLLSSDRNHPNAQGYRVMAEIILQRLVSKIGVF